MRTTAPLCHPYLNVNHFKKTEEIYLISHFLWMMQNCIGAENRKYCMLVLFFKLICQTGVMNDIQIITDGQNTDTSLVPPQISSWRTELNFISGFKTQKRHNQTCAWTSTTLQQLPGLWSLVDSFLCFSLWFSESRSDLSASHKTSRRMTTVSLRLRHTHTHTHLACGQCTDVITDIPGCYLFFIPLKDAFDKWYHK